MIGGPANASGWAFERFVGELVASMPGATEVDVETGVAGDTGVDISANVDGQHFLIVVKYQTPQTGSRLQEAALRLTEAAKRYQLERPGSATPRLVLAFPGAISASKHAEVAAEVWDGQFLRSEAIRLGISVPSVLIPQGELDQLGDHPTSAMERRLRLIEPGRAHWRHYEDFCEDLLNLLFCPPLNNAIPQSRNESGVNRRDFVLPNYTQAGFWNFMRVHTRLTSLSLRRKTLGRGSARTRYCSFPTI